MSQRIVIAALYRFVQLDNFEALRQPLLQVMLDNQVRGTLLLAPSTAPTGESVTFQLAPTEPGLWSVLAHQASGARIAGRIRLNAIRAG